MLQRSRALKLNERLNTEAASVAEPLRTLGPRSFKQGRGNRLTF